ncbi:hypothetical protein ACJD0Z_00370 [Flavobacteriaceae bacterium M23B6Z8]
MTFPCVFSNAQSAADNRLFNAYRNYYASNTVALYPHIYKEVFYEGEPILFTVHAFNRKTQTPDLETTNIYCGIYNSEGKQVSQGIFYMEKGVAKGYFEWDTSYGNGTFYLKSTTFLNSGKDKSTVFIRSFNVLKNEVSEELNKNDVPVTIKLYPEGGVVSAGVPNTFIYDIRDAEGRPLNASGGVLLDEQGKKLIQNLNCLEGKGKFSILIERNQSYKLRFTMEKGKIAEALIPSSSRIQPSISVHNLNPNQVTVTVFFPKTVQNTPHLLAVHRDGVLFTIDVDPEGRTQKSITLKRSDLLPGINLFTLFDNAFEPICERIIYNPSPTLENTSPPEFFLNSIKGDSLQMQVVSNTISDSLGKISISVLPGNTKFKPVSTNIRTSLLLQPYLRESFKHPELLIGTLDRKKRFLLDYELAMAGWSNTPWKTIENKYSKIDSTAREGFHVFGKVNKLIPTPEMQVTLYQPETATFLFTPLNKDKTFEFSGAYILKDSPLYFGVSNLQNKRLIPSFEVDLTPVLTIDSIDIIEKKKHTKTNILQVEISDKKPFVISNQTIELEGVDVIEESLESRLNRNQKLANSTYEGVKITVETTKRSRTLAELIRKLGFKVRTDGATNRLFVYSQVPFTDPPALYIDDVLSNGVKNYLLNFIDEVYYTNTPTLDSNGGSIYVYLRYGSLVGEPEKEYITKVIPETGFENIPNYENPLNPILVTPYFNQYGGIHWEYASSFNDQNNLEISFPDYQQPELWIILEGIAQDGKLFSFRKLLRK